MDAFGAEEKMKILLRDRNSTIVEAWKTVFSGYRDIEVSQGDIFNVQADSIISPANSFGFMDGGIDLAYTEYFGEQLQDRLKKLIHNEYYGEIPVGFAVVIETRNPAIKYLVSCPTMRVPENVENTVNAYLAFRAGLIAVKKWNNENSGKIIDSILCPGLGTLTGNIKPYSCAIQMNYAYDNIIKNKKKSFDILYKASEEHKYMMHPTPASTL